MSKIINVFLRLLTLLGKFCLIFFLARLLSPSEVGLYGLLVATIAYGLYFVGLDFYTFSTRDLLKRPINVWGEFLKSQAVLYVVTYTLFLPLSLFLFVREILPWSVFMWFWIILVLEHLNQEISRLLIAATQQYKASWLLFLRSGAWCFIVIAVMVILPESRHMELVLFLWMLSGLIAVCCGLLWLSRMGLGGWSKSINWVWIWQGVRVALPFLVGTLALRGIYTLDRYWIEHSIGLDLLGVYVLFIGMSNALLAFLDAGVFVYAYPAMMRAYNNHDEEGFHKELMKMLKLTVLFCIGFAIGSYVALPILLNLLNKPIYVENQYVFWWLLASTVVFALGMIPHYALYSKGYDGILVYSNIGGLLIFIVAVLALQNYDALLAVPISLIIVFFLVLLFKSMILLRLQDKNSLPDLS
ncbi:lipopolysaccharide biosynthesis protein [Pelistega sp. MC2]|uniref:lipopolysaccharide biosynthesis protein n=1 Tax=Pelistega sp. MC2 TaxID=1720297 RepID=UPI0008D9F328|nr:hypothetical protein [Pelistega sp. MC2]